MLFLGTVFLMILCGMRNKKNRMFLVPSRPNWKIVVKRLLYTCGQPGAAEIKPNQWIVVGKLY